MIHTFRNICVTCGLSAFILASGGVNASAKTPTVLSINLCADQMVMLLAEPAQIKALSTLSRDVAGSFYYQQAHEYAQADARAEDILPLAPDVVLTGPYTARHTLSLMAELGLNVQSLAIANSLEEMFANITLVGKILKQDARARLIVSSLRKRLLAIDAKSSALDATMDSKKQSRPKAAVYDANGYTVGEFSMRGEAMKLSGWHNVAEDKGVESYGVLHLEELIKLRPDALIESPYSEGTYSRGQMITKHPALRQAGLDPVLISLPSNQTICAGPWSVDIVEQLLTAREKVH